MNKKRIIKGFMRGTAKYTLKSLNVFSYVMAKGAIEIVRATAGKAEVLAATGVMAMMSGIMSATAIVPAIGPYVIGTGATAIGAKMFWDKVINNKRQTMPIRDFVRGATNIADMFSYPIDKSLKKVSRNIDDKVLENDERINKKFSKVVNRNDEELDR